MKILVLSQYWYPENGVPQRRWQWLSEILIDAGHEVVVITPPPHYKRSISLRQWLRDAALGKSPREERGPAGETILRSGYVPSGTSLFKRIFNQAVVATATLKVGLVGKGQFGRLNPDLIIGTVPALPTALATFVLSLRYRTPYVIDLRDAWPELFADKNRWDESTGASPLRQKFLTGYFFSGLVGITQFALNFVLKGAASLIVTTESLRERLIESDEKNGNYRSRNVAVVRNVFPSAELSAASQDLPSESTNTLKVLYAGTLGRAQKLENVIEASRLAKAKGLEIQLRLIGEGASKAYLKRLAKTVEGEIEVLDSVELQDLADHYQWADTALVHLAGWPSLEFAIPSKTFELMELGLHITAVVNGEASGLVEELGAGIAVTPERPEELAEAWIRLAKTPLDRRVKPDGATWVKQQRETVAPKQFLSVINALEDGERDENF